jgi:hypothetical protein
MADPLSNVDYPVLSSDADTSVTKSAALTIKIS